jgi:single-strand DNA-binding protein
MSNINIVVIEGNLVKAAELSRWNDGTPYCRFTIANNESYKDSAGNWVDITSFFDCMLRGNYGESMSKNLLKGRRVTVTGRLKQNRWKDKAGNTRTAVIIKVQEVSLAPGAFQPKEEGQQSAAPSFKPDNQSYDAEPMDYCAAEKNYSDSEIPF